MTDDPEKLKADLRDAIARKQLAEQREIIANRRFVEMSQRCKALKVESEQYKQAVDKLSAENSKHKKQLKRLMNKG